jgi:curved DNA-binding protein
VKIPKGVREGQRIRLAGLGESAGGSGQAGDLYLRIKLEKHPEFDVEGSDLFYELEIPAWQAVLGGDVEIPTLDGRAKLHVPAGSQNGQKFRLSGRGLTRKEGGRGNFYAVLRATLPREVDNREKELWRQIASLHQKH